MDDAGGSLQEELLAMAAEAQRHSLTGSLANPQGHGFIAEIMVKLAGNVTEPEARASVTFRSSSGWRRTSRVCELNSGNSSRKRTPRWARLSSPCRGQEPPPTSPTVLVE